MPIAAWVISCLLGFFVLARLFAHDATMVLIWVNAFTFWVYLPAYAIASGAALRRRWLLFALAGSVAAAHFAWVAPDYSGARGIPASAVNGPRVRLFTANAGIENPDLGPIAREIIAADPDVLFIQEFTIGAERVLQETGVAQLLPYRIGEASSTAFGTAIYSRFPFTESEIWMVAGIPMTRATIDLDGVALRLYNVHPVSPTSLPNVARWNHEYAALLRALESETDKNLVVAGDFNATQHQKWYGKLIDLPLRDAYRECGRGDATTWPNGMRWLPPVRIDQVFFAPGMGCVSIREGTGKGSDHRPVIAEIALER